MVQGRDIGARANVLFSHDHDVSVPGPTLLPFKNTEPVQIDFWKRIGGNGFEPAFKLFAVGDILTNRHGLKADMIDAISFDHPFDLKPDGEDFLAEPGGESLNHFINRFLVLFG